jgi:Zn-dependent protease with chaperone function
MTGLIVITVFLLTIGLVFVTNWLALIPWRRSRSARWAEQARLLYPVAVAARSNLWTVPATSVLIVLMFWPNSSPLWLLVGLASVLGAYAGTIPFSREVFPRIALRDLLSQSVIGLLLRVLVWVVFLGAVVMMPDELNGLAFVISSSVIVLWVLWTKGGAFRLGLKLGFFQPASERLRKIVADTSAKMNVPYREVLIMRAPLAQAFALPKERKLLFTERLLDLLPDDEVASICAHELAHLTESRTAKYSRSIVMLRIMPWLFFNPLTHAFGFVAFYGLLFVTLFIPLIYRRISHRLETRADEMAKANEGDAGTYARALIRLHEDSLVPAVMPKERATHPHLYDRLLAAGMTPDFPRPAAPSSMALHGIIFSGLLGMLFAFYVLHKMHF